LPMDSPLHKLGDRVLLSPHSASYTEGGELRQGVKSGVARSHAETQADARSRWRRSR
jgi:hypothetical protein